MRILVSAIGCVLLFAATLGCSRKAQNNFAQITIQAPTSEYDKAEGRVSALTSVPIGRKACYAVSIIGGQIPNFPADTCNPATGQGFGFVGNGELIQGTVAKGQGYTVDLYLYLQRAGENNPCPAMGSRFPATQLGQIYRLAHVQGVTLAKDTEDLTITASFPGEESTLAQEMSLPSSCIPGSLTNRTGFFTSTGAGTATGGSIRLHGVVGFAPSRGERHTGNGIRLQ